MQSVSGLLAVRNGERYLNNFILHIIPNLDDLDEFIVINDGSSDNTHNLLLDWSTRFTKIKYFNLPATGLVNALNFGVTQANSEWIARFDVDDFYAPNRIQSQRAMLSDNVVAVFSDYKFWAAGKGELGVVSSPVVGVATAISLISSQRTAHPSVIFRKSTFNQVGGYFKEHFPAEDLSLWLRLSHCGEIVSVPEILLEYQLTVGSISSNQYAISKEKSRELILEYGIPNFKILDLLRNLEGIFKQYDEFSFSNERKLLLILDIFRIWRLGFVNNQNMFSHSFLILKQLLKIGTIKSIIKLLVFKRRRYIFRKTNFSHSHALSTMFQLGG
jgi:glycosyltransferase involved in cell wall biosynthesis